MKPKHIHLWFLVLVACGAAAAQSADELQIPEENDNKFPPDNHADTDSVIEGSGDGNVDTTTDASPPPQIEAINPTSLIIDPTSHIEDANITPKEEISCPRPCVCHVEGEANLFTVDCAGYGLTEFPSPIDENTSTLNIKNNNITEVPKSISTLKNLKVLDAENNKIMELLPGSVSELPELTILNLANNRLIEYPNDLKNILVSSKLEEIDLGGNDIRTKVNPETFSNFKSLRKLTLPRIASTKEINQEICTNLIQTLEQLCTETCMEDSIDCDHIPRDEEQFIRAEAKLPGVITVSDNEDNTDQQVNATTNDDNNVESGTEGSLLGGNEPSNQANNESVISAMNFSLRTAVNNAAPEPGNAQTEIPENANQEPGHTNGQDVKIGATTSDTKTGGVDKSIIGMIVAGMVVVVAAVAIKKNWSSIKKRFSSAPRAANERVANGNGSAPEEVPLQDKSPV